MKCPRCKKDGTFNAQKYEGVEIDRCGTCSGVWLDEGELVKILSTQEKTFSAHIIEEAINTAFEGVPTEEKRSLEKCPKCELAMRPLNYAYSSGVIIDRCPESHGLWLDGNELEKLQAHKENWDKEADQNKDEWIKLAQTVQDFEKKQVDEIRKNEMRPTKYLVNSLIRKILGA